MSDDLVERARTAARFAVNHELLNTLADELERAEAERLRKRGGPVTRPLYGWRTQ